MCVCVSPFKSPVGLKHSGLGGTVAWRHGRGSGLPAAAASEPESEFRELQDGSGRAACYTLIPERPGIMPQNHHIDTVFEPHMLNNKPCGPSGIYGFAFWSPWCAFDCGSCDVRSSGFVLQVACWCTQRSIMFRTTCRTTERFLATNGDVLLSWIGLRCLNA